jgi:hypothetical protein
MFGVGKIVATVGAGTPLTPGVQAEIDALALASVRVQEQHLRALLGSSAPPGPSTPLTPAPLKPFATRRRKPSRVRS